MLGTNDLTGLETELFIGKLYVVVLMRANCVDHLIKDVVTRVAYVYIQSKPGITHGIDKVLVATFCDMNGASPKDVDDESKAFAKMLADSLASGKLSNSRVM